MKTVDGLWVADLLLEASVDLLWPDCFVLRAERAPGLGSRGRGAKHCLASCTELHYFLLALL